MGVFFLLLAAALPFAAETDMREARFCNPPASARLIPIHHCRTNDCQKADAELDRLQALGFGGFVGNVNFRGYLEDPACWKTFHHIVDEAHKRNLVVWLYDELGYPSGTCGGKTLQGHPEWAARAYFVAVTNVPYGSMAFPTPPPGRFVAKLRRPAGDGMREILYVISDGYPYEGTHPCVSASPFKYRYPNLLMREPTERFVALTHEAYRRELGSSLAHFTSTFTDEPSLMAYWMRKMPYYALPVSDELLSAWRAEMGHDLATDIPELLRGASVGYVAKIRHRFWTMVGERVAQNFALTLRKWADEQGILSGGHLLSEEDFVSQVAAYGDFFKVLRMFSAPGCDMLTSIPAQVVWSTALLAGSAGDLNGAKRVMSEVSDHCERCMTPRRKVTPRLIVGSINRQIWGGVNTFTSYCDFTPFSDDEVRAINLEVGRTLTLLKDSRSAADIAMLYPADTMMAAYEPQLVGGGGDVAQAAAQTIRNAGGDLFQAGYAFSFVDDASLSEAQVSGGTLRHGPLCWRVVILPFVTVLSHAAAMRLEEFRKAGGIVLCLGVAPDNTTQEFPSQNLRRITAEWKLLVQAGALLDYLKGVGYRRQVEVVEGRQNALRVGHRQSQEGEAFLVMNDTREPWEGKVRIVGCDATCVWDPRLGTCTAAKDLITLHLPPYAAVVVTAFREMQN